MISVVLLKCNLKNVSTSSLYSGIPHCHVNMSEFPQYMGNEGAIIHIFMHF